MMKARLTLQIYRIICERKLAAADAAKALGQDVEITVRPARKEHGEMSVVLD